VALAYRDLRKFIELCRGLGEVRDVRGASWDLDVGALIEAVAERATPPPLLVFDHFPGHSSGQRCAGLRWPAQPAAPWRSGCNRMHPSSSSSGRAMPASRPRSPSRCLRVKWMRGRSARMSRVSWNFGGDPG
jgi:hypothetical protein